MKIAPKTMKQILSPFEAEIAEINKSIRKKRLTMQDREAALDRLISVSQSMFKEIERFWKSRR